MILVDVNLLVAATMTSTRDHEAAHSWLHDRLTGTARVAVGLPHRFRPRGRAGARLATPAACGGGAGPGAVLAHTSLCVDSGARAGAASSPGDSAHVGDPDPNDVAELRRQLAAHFRGVAAGSRERQLTRTGVDGLRDAERAGWLQVDEPEQSLGVDPAEVLRAFLDRLRIVLTQPDRYAVLDAGAAAHVLSRLPGLPRATFAEPRLQTVPG